VSLNDKLRALRAGAQARLDPASWSGLSRTIEWLRMRQLAEHSLGAGDVLPDFELLDAQGQTVGSGELLDRAPLVLTFFRGGWCPYCSTTMRELEATRPELESLGATLVGIVPMKPSELARIRAERGLGFPLLSDRGGHLARLCGVFYTMSPAQVAYYRDQCGLDLPAMGADTDWELPLPATYVVGGDGVVAYAFATADWAQRAEPQAILEAVRGLKGA
jgi:peroxiredoxin